MITGLNYFLVFCGSLLGYLLGIGLGYIAPEELKPGRKYFSVLEKVFFVVAFLPIVYFFQGTWWIMGLILLGAVLLLFVRWDWRIYASFLIFLGWFFLIGSNDLVVILEASAIFLYGLPAGSLLAVD